MNDDLSAAPAVPPGYAPVPRFGGFDRRIGPIYERVGSQGYSRAFQVAEQHAGTHGACRGGLLMSFADSALGHAVTRGYGADWTIVRLMADFHATARLGDWVEGLGEIASADGDLITVRGRVWCGERTILTGAGIFKLREAGA